MYWNHWKSNGNPKKSFGIKRNHRKSIARAYPCARACPYAPPVRAPVLVRLWKAMEILWNPSKSIEINWNPWEITWDPMKYQEIYGTHGRSLEIKRNLWRSAEINGEQKISYEIRWDPRRSDEILGNPEEPGEIHRNLKKHWEINRNR